MNEDTKSNPTSIAELAERLGTTVRCSSHLPLQLDDPEFVWYIEQGSINLFLIEHEDGLEQVSPQHLMSRNRGELVPGVAPHEPDFFEETKIQLIAKGSANTILKRLPVSELNQTNARELAEQIDSWLILLTDTLSRYTKPIPRATELVVPGELQTSGPSTLSVRADVIWAQVPSNSMALFMDLVDESEFERPGGSDVAAIPLTRTSWLTFFGAVTLENNTSETLAQQGTLMSTLASFHTIALGLERLNRRLAIVDEVNLKRARFSSRREAETSAKQKLYNIYDLPIETGKESADSALVDALKIIAKRDKINFKRLDEPVDPESPILLADVLSVSGVRARRVQFSIDQSWWWGDSGTLLAFRKEDNRPVVLIPGIVGRYRQVDPVSNRTSTLTAEHAATLKDDAWMFYPSLSSETMKPKDMFKFALRGSAPDVLKVVTSGLGYSLIGLVPAFALGYVANQQETNSSGLSLYVLAAVLAGLGLLGAMLHILTNLAVMRIEGRSTTRVEAAFWDHLMHLPVSTLNRYPTGDLAMSGMTFQSIRDGLQGVVADSVVSIICLLPIFGIIFFYDSTLGFVALAFSLISLIITLYLGLQQSEACARMLGAARRVTGRLFQIIGGITKVRVENAEGSVYAIWAKEYRDQKSAEIEMNTITSHFNAFGAALPLFAAGTILYTIAVTDRSVPIADFLVVYTIFMVFQAAISRLGESSGAIAAVLPVMNQVHPLLNDEPEKDTEGDVIEYLGGDVLFDKVSFRYESNGPIILDNVTIEARSGEFVAIAGESGAGKSTLFQIALGIVQPTAGAIYYDDRDLRYLNIKQLRQKIGAVPQAIGLHPQDIWDNVVGHHEDIDTDEVWTATRIAKIEDQIKGMPMGMMTMVGTSGAVLSGGERQRVMIARAIVRQPRIMLLDEATNWLDNEIQKQVMNNLTSLTCTRIVIAHRLSTLQQADRIYVMQGGKVVQTGSFKELMEDEGVFKDLVQRQLA